MNPPLRAVVPALAVLAVLAIAAPASAVRFHELPAPSPIEEVRDGLVGLGLPVPTRREVASELARLTDAAQRASTPRFPVSGPFNWGQDGARYGAGRSGHAHEGQDVFARTGAPLVAVSDATVVETGNDGGRGNYIALHDAEARRTYVYLHMATPARAAVGDRVRAGFRVGAVGCTGSCFGDHLHFEIRRGRGTTGVSVDPLPALERWAEVHGARATLPPGQS